VAPLRVITRTISAIDAAGSGSQLLFTGAAVATVPLGRHAAALGVITRVFGAIDAAGSGHQLLAEAAAEARNQGS